MNLNWKIRAALLGGAALTISSALPAQAPTNDLEAAVNYDLPAQDLDQSLREIARLSGHEIMFGVEDVRGIKAPAIKGRFRLDQALRAAIADSRLELHYRAGTAIIRLRGTGGHDLHGSPGTSAITVTGTRIRGAGSTSPVTVTTRHELEQAGISDLADFTRMLPQNYAGGQNRGIPGGGEQGGQVNLNDSAALNLRGLGPDATLTLLDGNRLSYDALNQGIDISAIPLSAIERIEVITDGASALYGSDAVGGVANIILRRDFEGLETTARFGGATDGGDFQQEFSLVGGHRWTSGGFMVALDENSASPIYAGQRDYTRSIDPSLSLTDRIRQLSFVASAHQQIGKGLELDGDGYMTDRKSYTQEPFLPDADVHVSGIIGTPIVRSFALTPRLRADLGKWQASLSVTSAGSRTYFDGSSYSNGVPRRANSLYADRTNGAEFSAEGPLAKLPGGDARLALGTGVRGISLHDSLDVFGLFSGGLRRPPNVR